jgi:hypothetical protein
MSVRIVFCRGELKNGIHGNELAPVQGYWYISNGYVLVLALSDDIR